MQQQEVIPIVTTESECQDALRTKTTDFKEDELKDALEVATKLFLSLKPYVPAAGLAAPQIGISRSIFIYSYDRLPENLEIVINPTYKPKEDKVEIGWESCFSTQLCKKSFKIAKLARYQKIEAAYLNGKGEKVFKILEGFAAKAFQHECDHLQGIVNIEKPGAEVKEFSCFDELYAFMTNVKKKDQTSYIVPKQLQNLGF